MFSGGIKVEDRPMTQHGLSGMKTAGGGKGGSQRQIQDRTYWLGELRSKVNQLTTEMRKLDVETKQKQEENNTFLMFEKRAEILAQEVTQIRGELHDYNLMLDRINTNQELSQMVDDLNALKIKNDRDTESLERIFEQTESKENEILSLERELQRQRTLTENRVQDMDDKMKTRYSNLKKAGLETADHLSRLQDEMEELGTEQQSLEINMSGDPVKMEAIRLYETLGELLAKREQLEEEDKGRVSPEQEKEQLLSNVKMHNQDISVLDRQKKELNEKISAMQDEIQEIENELDDQESESTSKFRELQKRDALIESFMSTFKETKEREEQNVEQLHETNVVLLEQVSKLITTGQNLPSRQELRALKDDLEFKEGELQKAENTSQSLLGESSKLQEDLGKVEELHDKITNEKDFLTEKIEEMTKEIENYSDLDTLRESAVAKKKELQREEEELRSRKGGFKDDLSQLSQKHEDLKKRLEEDEVHMQLSNLERKWQHLEQTNFAMKEYIAANSADCDQLKAEILGDVGQANKMLQEICTKSSLMA